MSLILSAEWGRYGFAILTSFCLGTAVSRVLQSRRQLPIDVSALQDEDVDSDDEVFAEEEQSTDPSKMILCVRTDLKMGKGKMCAQCGHATLGCFRRAALTSSHAVKKWVDEGQRKIAVKVGSEEEMKELHQLAKSRGIPSCIIRDAGRTQVAAGSATVLAIGPATDEKLEFTSHLKLL